MGLYVGRGDREEGGKREGKRKERETGRDRKRGKTEREREER